MKRTQLVALLIAVGAVLIACGGGGSENFDDPFDDPDLNPDTGTGAEPPGSKAVCTPAEADAGYACRMIDAGGNWAELPDGSREPLFAK